VAVGGAARREERRPQVAAIFAGPDVEAALDLLAMADMAWHDNYGPDDLSIPPAVLEDILLLCRGDLNTLIRVSMAAVIDFRDVRVAAAAARA
jgi:hypothetical protein